MHQIGNLCAVVGAIEALRDKGYNITEDALMRGIKETKWQARFEVIPGNPVFILDTAANSHAAKTVAKTLNEWKKPDTPVLLLFGMLNDKDPVDVGKILFPMVNEIVLTQPENDRAFTIGQLQEQFAGILANRAVTAEASLHKALAYASHKMKDSGGYVLVTGSLFLMGKTREFLKISPMEDDFDLTDAIAENVKEKV